MEEKKGTMIECMFEYVCVFVCQRMGDIRWKGQCPFALLQHTEKFWNGFFQTFQAGLLFFSGGRDISPILQRMGEIKQKNYRK